MARVLPPKYVKEILITLQTRGYQAYLVGGCVRDMFLEVQPNDWDICTNALPETVMELFPGSVPTGIRHGTITVTVKSHTAEVTTFRTESNYSDHRHPDVVSFVTDLTSDLGRRDFTINAMAISADGILTDPFGGMDDLNRRMVRAVGDPEVRFEEDALRMFRAFRFSSRLGFQLEPETRAAICAKSSLASCLSPERIRDEVEKVIMTDSPESFCDLASTGLMDDYLVSRPRCSEEFRNLGCLQKKSLQRWVGLGLALMRAGAVSSAVEFLLALHLDNHTLLCCSNTLQFFSGNIPQNGKEWKQLLRRYGTETMSCAAACLDALTGSCCQSSLKSVLKSGECFSMRRLAVTGADLVALGMSGKAVGEMLEFLLDYVIDYPDNNRRELLLALARGGEE